MIEKPLQDRLIKHIEKLDLEFIHIPNNAFGKTKCRPKCIVDYNDVTFGYMGMIYFVELGIRKGNTFANPARKKRQSIKGHRWAKQTGGRFIFITSDKELDFFMNRVGI